VRPVDAPGGTIADMDHETEHPTQVLDAESDSDDGAVDVEVVDELLIEEISIDGMCGVY
jgi:mycofactocin precursor